MQTTFLLVCFQDVTYRINMCGPINYQPDYDCPRGNVGGCETSSITRSARNIGFLTSDPVINDDESITVLYTGKNSLGDRFEGILGRNFKTQ